MKPIKLEDMKLFFLALCVVAYACGNGQPVATVKDTTTIPLNIPVFDFGGKQIATGTGRIPRFSNGFTLRINLPKLDPLVVHDTIPRICPAFDIAKDLQIRMVDASGNVVKVYNIDVTKLSGDTLYTKPK